MYVFAYTPPQKVLGHSSSDSYRVSTKFWARYIAKQMPQDYEILLDCMQQNPLQYNIAVQNRQMKYTYIYCMTQRCILIHISIELTFKTAFYVESDVTHFKFDCEYYGDSILL